MILLLRFWFLFFVQLLPLLAGTFRVASYNVENLFDMRHDGTEYAEYIPNGQSGWNHSMFETKTANIASVIKELDADIIALQEIESAHALEALNRALKQIGSGYPYWAIADSRPTTVKVALLSRFPIVKTFEILPEYEGARAILEAHILVENREFIIFVNHWKSKSGPESRRISYARALKERIDALDDNADFVLLGDFNSNFNEFETFVHNKHLNDTEGITGINHILGTTKESQLVNEEILTNQPANEYLYNLWLELPPSRRWSHNFYGDKNSLDNMIVSKGLYDDQGIAYVDQSFDKFDAPYLFKGRALFRWQIKKNRHQGAGYSDHLPIFAQFSTEPFVWKNIKEKVSSDLTTNKEALISDLYNLNPGSINFQIRDAVVLYRHQNSAVVKQKNGRAIFIYNAAHDLEVGKTYDFTALRLYRHQGLLELTAIESVRKKNSTIDPSSLYLDNPNFDLSDPIYQNEMVTNLAGWYEKGRFRYGSHSIRLYFKNKEFIPKKPSFIRLLRAHVGSYKGEAELIVYRKEDFLISNTPISKE